MTCAEETTLEFVSSLESRLQNRLIGRVRGLRLVMCERGLVLRGQAFSYYAKQLAQHGVMAESLLPLIANEIVVN